MRRIRLGLIGLLWTVGGCGWNYAGTVKKAPAPTENTPTPTPVETPRPPADRPGRLAFDHEQGVTAQGPADMGQHAFSVAFIDGFSEAQRIIHCSTGKVIRFTHQPVAPDKVEQARAEGIPLGQWTWTVDPTGANPNLPDQVMIGHVTTYHQMELVKRYEDGRAMYRYVGLRK